MTALALVGCNDAAGPRSNPPEAARQESHPLHWAPRLSPRVFGGVSTQPGEPLARAIPDAPAVLSTYALSFWAYTGRGTSATVSYLASDSTWQPYVTLSVPRGALLRRPDGSWFTPGDSIEMTITLDTALVLVDLQPTGLVFHPLIPARLTMSYGGSNPDYNGDGLVNASDSYIEQFLMGVWVRQYPSDPWEPLNAIQSLLSQVFAANLRHFSEYAVSW